MNQLLAQLVAALEAADTYLNSYDTSAPSRIKAQTRADVEAALGLARASLPPEAFQLQPVRVDRMALSRVLGASA